MSDPFVFEPLAQNAANPEVVFNDNFTAVQQKFDALDDEPAGASYPPGGTDGQFLAKDGDTDPNKVKWANPPSGGGGGGGGSGGGGGGLPTMRPPPAGFFPVSVNGTGVVAAQAADFRNFVLTRSDLGSNGNERMAAVVKAAPSGAWSASCIIKTPSGGNSANFVRTGMVIREASTNKMIFFGLNFQGGTPQLSFFRYNGPDTYVEALRGGVQFNNRIQDYYGLRIAYNGTSYTLSFSPDLGTTWIELHTFTAASQFVATQYGLALQTFTTIDVPMALRLACCYWEDADLPPVTGPENSTAPALLRDRNNRPAAATFPTILGTDGKLPILTEPTLSEGLRFDFGAKPTPTGDHIRMAVRAAEANKNYDFRIITGLPYANFVQAGIVLRNSGNNRLATIGPHFGSNGPIDYSVLLWNNQTTYADILTAGAVRRPHEREWVRLRFDASTVYLSASPNGKDWFLIRTFQISSHLQAIDQIGLFVQANFTGGWDVTGSFPFVETLFFGIS